MKSSKAKFVLLQLSLWMAFITSACNIIEESQPKNAPLGLITTPASYYSTPKARYLGQKYKLNLDRMVERIVRNPKTANLQFANNIASVGGIGFFTHSAATLPDERYLEVVLAAPETFEVNGEYSAKVSRLFTLYGSELLSILASDTEIYQEPEVAGYGLNLSWRKVVRDSGGPRVVLERAITYLPKPRVRGFLRHDINQNELLRYAVIFAVEEDGPMSLVSYRPPDPKADFRSPIQEETLSEVKEKPKSNAAAPLPTPPPENIQGTNDRKIAEEPKLLPAPKPVIVPPAPVVEKKPETKSPSVVTQKSLPPARAGNQPAEDKADQKIAEKRLSEITSESEKGKPLVGETSKASVANPEIATPKSEIVPPMSDRIVKQSEVVPNLPAPTSVPKTDSAVKSELREPTPVEKISEPPMKPSLPVEPLMAPEAAPSAGVIKPSTNAAPAAKPTPVQEAVKEVKAPQQIANPAKVPEPVVEEVHAKNEPPPAPIVVPPAPSVKVPVVTEPVAKREVTKSVAQDSKKAVQPTNVLKPPEARVVEEKSREPITSVQDTGSTTPNPVGSPVTKDSSTKNEIVGETKAEDLVVAKAETVRPPDPPLTIRPEKTEALPPQVKSEVKPRAPEALPKSVMQKEQKWPEPTPLPPSVAKTESPKVTEEAKLEEQKAAKPVTVTPKNEIETAPRDESMLKTLPPAKEQKTVETSPKVPIVTKVEEVKAPDQPGAVEAKKQEPEILTPKPVVKAPSALTAPTVQPVPTPVSQPKEAIISENKTEPTVVKAETAKLPETMPAEERKLEVAVAPKLELEPEVVRPKPEIVSLPKIAEPAIKPWPAETGKVEASGSKLKDESKAENVPAQTRAIPKELAQKTEKPAGEQLALLTKKPSENAPEVKPPVRAVPKALEGYVIQLAFSDQGEAQRWAENLTGRGYAVSVTEAGAGAFRVRVGNFPGRGEAERQLKALNQNGLKGIVINLPQAYRPEVHSAAPDAAGQTISVTP